MAHRPDIDQEAGEHLQLLDEDIVRLEKEQTRGDRPGVLNRLTIESDTGARVFSCADV